MSKKLQDKVAIVTGSGRGIGRGIALRLAQDGATVVVADINADNVKKVAEEIKALGARTLAMVTDVTKEADVQKLVDTTVAEFGKLDIMVANAGIANIKMSIEMTADEWDKIFAVNCRGVFICDTVAARQMIKQGHKGTMGSGGRIINCASIAAHSGFSILAAYSASKFAVRGFTQALAKELGPHKITVNAYCPGIVGTDMWGLIDEKMGPYLGMGKGEVLKEYTKLITAGTVGVPEEVACFVSYLASSDADYMTGQSVMIDGGIVMN
ncbi:glucose 1-dehydrogenase [Geomonas sp. RF6]|uniref:glucose 1-dehydrogenase n=1 Tax=Geomonas sp. RF6 TaxID=2897342 RepID=UPI001E2FC311|nr:glucose 1-dehydrogenase [Geomonas sp. RF6]UFS70687.1 glucose 1-dehydrogenase [Geomonas sp. RF6]